MKAPRILADVGVRALRLLDPEKAHEATISLLRGGLGLNVPDKDNPALRVKIAGIDFPNPLGLAAGFDKNAEAPDALLRLGFGFVETGAVTPLPQPGNPRPRVFRLPEDGAVINRYGFNNDGLVAFAQRLKLRKGRGGVVGVNLGANQDSADRTEDYVAGVVALEGLVDFYTVNVSSPNTPGLRALQDKAALMELMSRVQAARDNLALPAPVFLKISPDLNDEDKSDIADVVRALGVEALIVSNTTVARDPTLRSAHAAEKGGLSGRPLFAVSTEMLRDFRHVLGATTPLIGVGGVFSGDDAYAKIKAGASLVQLYTALIYHGPGLIPQIINRLDELLSEDGFSNIAEACGVDA